MICDECIKINYTMCIYKKKKYELMYRVLAKNLFSLNNVKINLKIEEK